MYRQGGSWAREISLTMLLLINGMQLLSAHTNWSCRSEGLSPCKNTSSWRATYLKSSVSNPSFYFNEVSVAQLVCFNKFRALNMFVFSDRLLFEAIKVLNLK